MNNFLPRLLNIYAKNKITLSLLLAVLLIFFGGFSFFQKFSGSSSQVVEENEISFDAEGPYAVLIPRRDGNALILSLKRTSSYDTISYELAYNAEGIDRGVVGSIDTKVKKGEYEQEILLGTCSKNVCKYDKDVENGTLTLHIKKGARALKMITQWHLQRPDVALGVLSSGDGHFKYFVKADRSELALTGYTIINDLTGLPKLPEGREVLGKVYSLNVPLAKELKGGQVSIELAENPPADAKLARFSEKDNKWLEMESKGEEGKLSGSTDGSGIFAVLTLSNP